MHQGTIIDTVCFWTYMKYLLGIFLLFLSFNICSPKPRAIFLSHLSAFQFEYISLRALLPN
jgi:hypothetical protein